MLFALSTLGILPPYPNHKDMTDNDTSMNNDNDNNNNPSSSSVKSIISEIDRSMSTGGFEPSMEGASGGAGASGTGESSQKIHVDLSQGLTSGIMDSLSQHGVQPYNAKKRRGVNFTPHAYVKEFQKINHVFPDIHVDAREGDKRVYLQFMQLIRLLLSLLPFRSLWTWVVVLCFLFTSTFAFYGFLDMLCLFKYGMHATEVLNPHFLFVTASCWV
jgi:hypothetical protein